MNALGAGRLLLGCALLSGASAVAMVFYAPLVAAVLAAVCLLLAGAGWLAVEAHRQLQEYGYQVRRSIGRWS